MPNPALPHEEQPLRVFRLGERGLRRVLGSLEERVMSVLWDRGRSTIAEVQRALGGGVAFNTVMTVMNRLVDKGLLRREVAAEGRASVYEPVVDRGGFLRALTREVSRGLIEDFGEDAVAQFVDVLAELDPELLDALRRRLDAQGGRDGGPERGGAPER